MFKILNKIDANKFCVKGDHLLVLHKNKITLYKHGKVTHQNQLNEDFTSLFCLKNDFLIRRDDNTALILKTVESGCNLSTFLDGIPVDQIDTTGKYVVTSQYESYYPVVATTKLISVQSKDVIFSSNELVNSSIIKEFFLCLGKDAILVHNLNNRGLKTRLNFDSYLTSYKTTDQRQAYDRIRNYIGLHKHILWVSLSSGKLLAFNIDRGNLENQIGFRESDLTSFAYKVQAGDYLPFGGLVQLDEEREKIIGLRDKYFMRIDLNQSDLRREYIPVAKSMDAHSMSSSYRNNTFPIDEKHIYFCDDRRGKIGVFDQEKMEVIWSYELEMMRDGISQILDMKYEGNKWYVLDRNDVLHIFERV